MKRHQSIFLALALACAVSLAVRAVPVVGGPTVDTNDSSQRERITSFESRLATLEPRLPKVARADRRD